MRTIRIVSSPRDGLFTAAIVALRGGTTELFCCRTPGANGAPSARSGDIVEFVETDESGETGRTIRGPVTTVQRVVEVGDPRAETCKHPTVAEIFGAGQDQVNFGPVVANFVVEPYEWARKASA